MEGPAEIQRIRVWRSRLATTDLRIDPAGVPPPWPITPRTREHADVLLARRDHGLLTVAWLRRIRVRRGSSARPPSWEVSAPSTGNFVLVADQIAHNVPRYPKRTKSRETNPSCRYGAFGIGLWLRLHVRTGE